MSASGSWWSAGWFACAVVELVVVECDVAEFFAGGGVDDFEVGALDQKNDGGSIEGSSECDSAELSFVAKGDSTVVDAVVADSWFGLCLGCVWVWLWVGSCTWLRVFSGSVANCVADGGCSSRRRYRCVVGVR